MTAERLAVGAYGERLAARHLTSQGLVLLNHNWRCSDGELDLVLRDGHAVVFCEVKTRRIPASGAPAFGSPAEAVDPRKVRRIRALALRWLDESSVRPREIRFDVVEVLLQPRGAALITHLPAAF